MKLHLVEHFGCAPISEKYLTEATFKGDAHLSYHHSKHVLAEDEQFDRGDPKFPHVSKEEYAKNAEELSLKDASEIHSEEELKNARGIIGWVATDPSWKSPRCIKINTDSEKMPGYIEIVGYIDDAEHGNQIFTYMLARRSKKYREFARKIAELPENLEKVVNNND